MRMGHESCGKLLNGGKQGEGKAGAVKEAAISFYGERFLQRSTSMKSFQMYNYPEKLYTRARDVFTRGRNMAESESELVTAKKMEKKKAEVETISSQLKMESCSSLVETLMKEIEEINGEHVLVELAKIEAIKEYEEIVAQRKDKNERFLAAREVLRKKTKKMVRKIENAKELEKKFNITLSDISVLQNELKKVKEIDRNVRYHDINSLKKGKKVVTKELEAANKELALIKEDGLQCMASMDIVKNELAHVVEDISRLKKKEEQSNLIFENLSSELLRPKANLEAISAAEEGAQAAVSNLSLNMERLKSEAKTAKKELSLINEETAIIKEENKKTDAEIDLAEERMQAALQDLKAVKSSEAIALEKLKEQVEMTMKSRASASKRCSTITISRFEYDYLIGRAYLAKEIADKKVSAAQTWIEAIKASEREIMIKSKSLSRETEEIKYKEEHELHETEASTIAKVQPETAVQREAFNRSFRMTHVKTARHRRASCQVGSTTSNPKFLNGRRGTSKTFNMNKKIHS